MEDPLCLPVAACVPPTPPPTIAEGSEMLRRGNTAAPIAYLSLFSLRVTWEGVQGTQRVGPLAWQLSVGQARGGPPALPCS